MYKKLSFVCVTGDISCFSLGLLSLENNIIHGHTRCPEHHLHRSVLCLNLTSKLCFLFGWHVQSSKRYEFAKKCAQAFMQWRFRKMVYWNQHCVRVQSRLILWLEMQAQLAILSLCCSIFTSSTPKWYCSCNSKQHQMSSWNKACVSE